MTRDSITKRRSCRTSLQDLIEPFVCGLAFGVGEVVRGVGGDEGEFVFGFEEVINFAGFGEGFADAGDVEVGVFDRGVGEDGAGGDGGEDFVEVEGDFVGVVVVDVADAGHVAVAGPAGDFAAVVVVEGGEAAASDDGFDAVVEDGGEERVVAAEGVADDADAVFVYLREGLQEIDGAQVVPDGFHGAAGAVCALGFEVVGVFAEGGVVGDEADVAAFGEFVGVVERGFAAEASGFVFADAGGLMEAEHGGGFAAGWQFVWNEDPGGDVVAEFGGVVDFATKVFGGFFFGDGLYIKRGPAGGVVERAHDLLHAVLDVSDAFGPVGGGLDGALGAFGVADDEEVGVVGIGDG